MATPKVSATVYDVSGKESGQVELPEAVFNVPVNAVKVKAAHVHFRMSDAIRLNDRWVEAIPNNRRSMTAIVPKTRARPMTCVDSIRGNSQSESRILVAIPDASSDLRKATLSIGWFLI